MDEETTIAALLAAKMKERGLPLRKLSEVSGISTKHLEALLRGANSQLPPAPYVRGYLIKLGEVLDFDGQAAWESFRREGRVQVSGGSDALPKNRFALPRSAKPVAITLLFLAVLIYLGLRLWAWQPELKVVQPATLAVSTSTESVTLAGYASPGAQVYINAELVPATDSGDWQKTVLLEPGLNTFVIGARRRLGGERRQTLQVFLESKPTTTPALPSPAVTIPRASTSSPLEP
ncbi:MAG: helix-turn-helix domain-containing protein [Candidatus Liptonbacteria bacterium]|nr:helix-turn-helix domain-containing protein [Candidatus Liptonbacteria bacterium]